MTLRILFYSAAVSVIGAMMMVQTWANIHS